MSKIKDFLKSPLGTALCAAAACLLAVVLVWLAAVRPNNDKSLSERISDDYSQYSAELGEANGAAQTFDTDNDLLAMAFVFGTSNGQPTGELHLELADADTGEVLARSTGDMANIVAGQYTGMGLDTPVTGSAGRRYRVTLKPEYTGSGRLTVGCSNGAVLWNDTFTVNGEAVDGTLALLVTYKQIGGFLTRFFLLVGLLASVVVFLGIYFAMRGRMPLHRLVFVLVLCFGMLYSFVLPPYAAPDEKYHINQSFTLACKWANMLSPDEWRMGNVPLDMTYRREHDFDPLLQNEKTTVFSWQELSENLFTTTPDSFDSHTALEELQTDRNPTLYLFSAAAVFLAYVFHLGFVPALMLGRTANLIVFALLAALAVKAAPFGRRVFAAAALLPMTLHLAASFSRDSLLLGLAFAFTALCMQAIFGCKDGTVLPVRLEGAERTYFSRLSGRHPKQAFPKIRLSILPARHFPMPEGATAKLRRRKSGEAMRRLMQEMIVASRPQQTLYAALCAAADIYGRRRRLLEDVKQVEYSYNDLLKMALMLDRKSVV